MKPARFLLPISVLILGMSQSALAEKDGTAETVEAEKKEAPAPWAGSTVVYSNFARIQTTYDYAPSRCGNAGTNAADPVNIDADGCEETDLGNNYDPYYAMSLSLRPSWRLNETIGLSARFDVNGELTTPNSTNRRVMIGDLSVSSSFGNLYTIPGADIGVSALINARSFTTQRQPTRWNLTSPQRCEYHH